MTTNGKPLISWGIKAITWVAAGLLAAQTGWGHFGVADARAIYPSPAASVENIAHRGASGHAPESTLSAFRLAVRMGADRVELDVQQSRDGELMTIHDSTLDRTTDGHGKVREHDRAQLKRLDAGAWFKNKHPQHRIDYQDARIPTLDEVLHSLGTEGRYCIEIKEGLPTNTADQVLATLSRHQLLQTQSPEQVIIQSFDPAVLKQIHQKHPELTLIQLIHYRQAGSLSRGGLQRIATYADGIGFHHRRMEREDIRRAHREGLRIHAYTVNQKKKMRRLLDWDVDAICTDFPDRLREVKREQLMDKPISER
ncbi:glycerophosphoryl diester phosphodiesterase [Desmospora activa DSM 45169]|uniref:Glycerophosphoryl diester phosphodiesterase n=2 Tax=Desmospora TaxID=500614 RepID=A0A2T4Z1X8_9BACL|nr:glycerophosphoryl diester phosphodiesterase [Desmospora activa DSM 45169]